MFSLARAYRAAVESDWSRAGFEREVSQTATRSGKAPQGFYVPADALASRATIASSDVSDVFATEHAAGMLAESLKPLSVAAAMGATLLTGRDKDVNIPAADGSLATTYWLTGDDDGPTDSDPGTRTIALSYHGLATTMKMSRKVVVQGDPAMEMIFRQDAMREIATAVDKTAIAGSGSSNQPTGILATSGIGSVVMGADGGAVTWQAVVDLMTDVMSNNVAGSRFGFVTNHKVRGKMLTIPRIASTNSRMILDDATPDKLAGFNAAYSANVPSNLTKGDSTGVCSAMIFGDWASLYIAQFGAIDVIVDPYSESAKGNVRVSLDSAWDIGVRYAEAFAAIKDLTTA